MNLKRRNAFCEIRGQFSEKRHQRALFEHIAKEKGIAHYEQWYSIRVATVLNFSTCSKSVLQRYFQCSLIGALLELYPEIAWQVWKFENIPLHYWEDISNTRYFLRDLGKKLSITEPEQWRGALNAQNHRLLPSGLLRRHGDCVWLALKHAFPENAVIFDSWIDIDRESPQMSLPRKYHKKRCVKRNTKRVDHRKRSMREHQKRADPIIRAVSEDFVGHFQRWPWQSVGSERELQEAIARHLSLQSPKDWLRLDPDWLRQHGIYPRVSRGYSRRERALKGLLHLLKVADADGIAKRWELWMFQSRVPRHFWRSPANVRHYLTWLSEELRVVHLEDWRVISKAEIIRMHGNGLLRYLGGLRSLIAFCGAADDRDSVPCNRKGQRLLFRCVEILFPKVDLYENFHHPALCYSRTGKEMELDLYLPSLSIALEYQGRHHYLWHYTAGSPSHRRSLDQEKQERCTRESISLVEVPYSWNGDLKNLASSIRLIRPDLLLDTDTLFLRESTENEQYNRKLSEANPSLSETTRKESILSSVSFDCMLEHKKWV